MPLQGCCGQANATKGELEAAQSQLNLVLAELQKAQADLLAFQNRLRELAEQKDTLGKSVESLTAQLMPVDAEIAAKRWNRSSSTMG